MTAAKPGTLAEALAALQAALPAVGKHATADVRKEGKKLYDYSYAPGESITPVLYPLMGALGLSYLARPSLDEAGRFGLYYELLHTSGDMRQGFYPLPDPDRYGPQDLGKAITYARRYALCALVGLFPGGDDNDANDIQQPERKPRNVPDSQLAAEGRMTRREVSGHDQLKADTLRDRKRAERSHPKAPDPDDPWAKDEPMTGQRAQQLRQTLADPEDKPGSILPGQHRALEKLLSMLGPDFADRDTQHELVSGWTGHAGLASMNDLSVAEAADAIRGAQDAVDRAKEAARA